MHPKVFTLTDIGDASHIIDNAQVGRARSAGDGKQASPILRRKVCNNSGHVLTG